MNTVAKCQNKTNFCDVYKPTTTKTTKQQKETSKMKYRKYLIKKIKKQLQKKNIRIY